MTFVTQNPCNISFVLVVEADILFYILVRDVVVKLLAQRNCCQVGSRA